MKKYQHFAILIVFLFLAGTLAFTQEGKTDRATVPFSDSSKPGFIEASVYNGSVTIRGYEGKEVIIPHKGPVRETLQEITGGIRSACAYVGADRLKDLSKCTTFVIRSRTNGG